MATEQKEPFVSDVELADRQLAQREMDGLTVTLLWVQNTLRTYVTVEDFTVEEDKDPLVVRIETPENVTPNDLYNHPFKYLEPEKK